MRIRDRALWQGQRAEADAEYGQGFLDFVEAWCERAELAMVSPSPESVHHYNALGALRATLNPTEDERGVLPPGWTAQMLLVIVACWVHGGPELLNDMTTLEKKMCADMAAVIGVEVVADGPAT